MISVFCESSLGDHRVSPRWGNPDVNSRLLKTRMMEIQNCVVLLYRRMDSMSDSMSDSKSSKKGGVKSGD